MPDKTYRFPAAKKPLLLNENASSQPAANSRWSETDDEFCHSDEKRWSDYFGGRKYREKYQWESVIEGGKEKPSDSGGD
jgi:hypothetical protein